MQSDDPLNALLGDDDLARLAVLFTAFNHTDLDLRGFVLVLDALMAQHTAHVELVKDLLATRGLARDAMARNASCLDAIREAYQRVQAARLAAFDPTTARPVEAAEQPAAPLATLAVSKTVH